MPACFAKTGLLAAGLLLVVGLSPAGGQQSDLPCKTDGTCRSAAGKLVQCIYSVADLVIPIEDSPRTIRLGEGDSSDNQDTPKARPKTQEEKLIRLIVHTIAPKSWSGNGGRGTIDYAPEGMALIINQTADVQDQVADLLAAVRRLQDVQVSLEVRIVTVPENIGERVGGDVSPGKAEVAPTPGSIPGLFKHLNIPFTAECAQLNDKQAAAFLEAIQGGPQTSIQQVPKVTAANGQRIAVEITDRKLFFAGMDVERQPNGQVISRPKAEPISAGLGFALQPVVSADQRSVELDMTLRRTELDSASAVAQAARPAGICNEGKESPTAPERQARFTTRTLRWVGKLRDGGTLILDNGLRVVEGRNEYGPPVLSNIPYVGRLFKSVGYGRETVHELVLVTPRIIVHEEEEVRPLAVSSCPFLRQQREQAQMTSAPKPACPVTVLDNLAKLEKAQATYRQAQKMRLAGRREQAARSYDKVCRLCPGSRLDQLARRQLAELQREEVAQGGTEEQEATPAVAPQTKNTAPTEKKLTKLLRRYHEACAEGRLADAKKLACRALAIDPKCFSKAGK